MEARTGEIAGLFASFVWAIGSLVFSRARAAPAALNLFKNSVAAVLFVATLVLLPGARPGALLSASPVTWGWLALSALIGLFLGDTFYFRSLQILGPRRALVLTTLTPLLAAGLGFWLLGQGLTGSVWMGMALTLAGVVWVIREAPEEPVVDARAAGKPSGSATAGVACGLLGSLCQALGAVWSRIAMEEIEPLEASAARLAIAAAAGLAAAVLSGRLRAFARDLFAPGVAAPLAAASALGTYLGIWASLTAFKHSSLAVATTLTTLSPVFVIPLAWLFLRERSSPRAVLGAALAVGGVAVLF